MSEVKGVKKLLETWNSGFQISHDNHKMAWNKSFFQNAYELQLQHILREIVYELKTIKNSRFCFSEVFLLSWFYKGRYFKNIFMKSVNVHKNILIHIKKSIWIFETNFKAVQSFQLLIKILRILKNRLLWCLTVKH